MPIDHPTGASPRSDMCCIAGERLLDETLTKQQAEQDMGDPWQQNQAKNADSALILHSLVRKMVPKRPCSKQKVSSFHR